MAIDTDRGGTLSRDEIMDGRAKFLIDDEAVIQTEEDVDNFIKFADVNGDGEIDIEEFLDGVTRYE